MIPGSATPLLLSNQDTGYKIDRSLRFNSGDSSKISRTPSSASNRKTWTMSYWVKRAKLSTEQMVFSAASSSSDRVHFYYESTDNIAVYSPSFYYTTNVIARDPGAWQHLVFACDTTQSTDTDRFKIYVNSVLVTSFVNQSHPSQNLDTPVSNNILHQFSGRGYNSSNHADVYLAEINFVDGQQLAPTDFGEFDDNNVWQPKETNITPSTPSGPNKTQDWDSLWTGTIYGSPYAFANVHDTSIPSVGDTVLNTNSVLPANNQSLVLTPTTPITVNTSVVLRGADGGGAGADKLFVINAGRTGEVAFYQKPSGSGFQDMTATAAQVGGKIHTITLNGRGGGGGNSAYLGSIFVDGRHLQTGGPVADVDNTFHLPFKTDQGVDYSSLGTGTFENSNWGFAFNGKYQWTTTNNPSSNADQFACPANNTTVTWTGNVPVASGQTVLVYYVAQSTTTGQKITVNGTDLTLSSSGNSDQVFSADVTSIVGSAITSLATSRVLQNGGALGIAGITIDGVPLLDIDTLGYDASGNNNNWTSNNLVAAAAGLETANQGFDVVNFTGNHPTGQSITNLNFQPDLVWIKDRSGANWHYIFDSVRGVEKAIFSNATNAENTYSNTLTAFNSNGFTLGSDNATNQSSNNYVAWCWKAGGTASSNTDGSITSSVSANNTYGFSVVSYTGNGSAATIGHGLSSTPKWIIKKFRSATSSWDVYHESVGAGKRLVLNTTDAEASTSSYQNVNSSTFDVHAGNNDNGATMIAYCWSEISGFSKFGSYTGTGAAGVSVTTGFKPRWVMIKETSNANSWFIYDTQRGTTNILWANSSNSESTIGSGDGTNQNAMQVSDTGFSIPHTLSGTNRNGGTFIYAAFAGKPPGEIIDSLIDTPTNYQASGNNGGNYATLNPVNKHNTADTFSEGNLKLTSSGSGAGHFGRSTIAMSSGKYYWEVTWDDTSHNFVGIQGQSDINYNNSYVYLSNAKASATNGSSEGSSYGASWGNGDVIGIAYDADNATLTFYKNGVSQGTAFTSITGTYSPYPDGYVAFFGNWGNQACTFNVNFGQRPFAYTPPTGYKSLCTTNLPDPTIADGSTAFDTSIWSGNSTQDRKISTAFSPDFVWVKRRNAAKNHILIDAIRGDDNYLHSNTTNANQVQANLLGLVSDGYELGTVQSVNLTGNTYVGWAWDAGSSNTSISAGVLNSSTYDQSQTWSSGMKATGNQPTRHAPLLVRTTTCSLIRQLSSNSSLCTLISLIFLYSKTGVAGTWLYVEFGTALANVTSIIFSTEYSCPGGVIKLNGTDVAVDQSNLGGGFVEVSVTGTIPASLNEIAIQGNGGSARLKYLKINGKYLIDSGVTPTNVPTIASTVRANPSAGFSIVSYTGTGSTATIGHGLNAAPGFIVIKSRTNADAWPVYHQSLSNLANNYLTLHTTNAVGSITNYWNGTNSNVIGVLGGYAHSSSGQDYIAYCFAPVEGYSAFGSYTGNGSSDGPFVFTGFRPKLIVIKGNYSGGDWLTVDTERVGIGSYNVATGSLAWNLSQAESYFGANNLDILSNGFKIRSTNPVYNTSSTEYLYLAFAEHPFKTARAR